MGNDWFHEYFINELKAIRNHSKCADGKSAYDYAVEGGYTGTETEFAEKMAEEQLTGATNELTPTQVYDAVSSGIPVKVQYTDPTFGTSSFTAFNVSESMNLIASNAIVNYNNVYLLAVLYGIKSDNRWLYEITPLAEKTDIPDALPNPNSLTFTGAVTGSYDGSAALSVEIPTGMMIVTITDNNGTLSADMTFSEILNAINAGTTVLVSYNGTDLPLIALSDNSLHFGVFHCANADDVDPAAVGASMIEITANGEVNDLSALIFIPTKLPNPRALKFTGAVTGAYDGTSTMTVNIPSAVTDEHINSLIDTKLGVIENGAY